MPDKKRSRAKVRSKTRYRSDESPPIESFLGRLALGFGICALILAGLLLFFQNAEDRASSDCKAERMQLDASTMSCVPIEMILLTGSFSARYPWYIGGLSISGVAFGSLAGWWLMLRWIRREAQKLARRPTRFR